MRFPRHELEVGILRGPVRCRAGSRRGEDGVGFAVAGDDDGS